MENNYLKEMLENEENIMTVPRKGDIIKGKVVQVSDDEVIVNIGYKSDGIIPLAEISNNPNYNVKENIKEGEDIDVYVIEIDNGEGNVFLSKRRVDSIKDWDELKEIAKKGKTITVRTSEAVRGGVIAYYKEIRGFIPASQLSDKYVENLEEYCGKELEVKAIEVDNSKRKAVFSHKVVIEEAKNKKIKEFWESIEKDIVMEGEVKRLTNFGAFVDLGGVDGLVHVSEISWGRIKHPSDVLKIGDRVKVYVKDFDKEKGKISLSLKDTVKNPWLKVYENYKVGEIKKGKVVKLVDFGAFVELEPGIEGLVHISQISQDRVSKPSDVLEKGQIVNVKVLDVDMKDKRISLSIKDAQASEEIENYKEKVEEFENTTIGDIIKSKKNKEE